MGWKSIREHYGLDGIVKIKDGRVHIGAGYLGSLLVVNVDGTIHEYGREISGSIGRCAAAIAADPETFRTQYERQDVFERSILVHTWDADLILDRYCEQVGWPNVTHEGDLMADNRYSQDREEVIAWAKEDARSGIAIYRRDLQDIERNMMRVMELLAATDRVLDGLLEKYPDDPEPDRVE